MPLVAAAAGDDGPRRITTIEELEAALRERPSELELEGDLALEVHRRFRRRKVARYVGIGIGALAIVAIPLTGGVSGVVALTAGEGTLAFLALGTVALSTLAWKALDRDYDEIELSLNPPRLRLVRRRP